MSLSSQSPLAGESIQAQSFSSLISASNVQEDTSVVTVSVATFLFAFVMALGATDSAGKDVLAATAAYAAVLVVFVGTSLLSS